MFDPQSGFNDSERLYEIGREVYRLTRDEEIALPIIKSAADHGWSDAARFLALYYLGKTSSPDPYIDKYSSEKIDYRWAAEFALACGDKEILLECFSKCQPGELDDIKARVDAYCKNYDPVGHVCVINQDQCRMQGLCDWELYTELNGCVGRHYKSSSESGT